jgi:hypothetical protein
MDPTAYIPPSLTSYSNPRVRFYTGINYFVPKFNPTASPSSKVVVFILEKSIWSLFFVQMIYYRPKFLNMTKKNLCHIFLVTLVCPLRIFHIIENNNYLSFSFVPNNFRFFKLDHKKFTSAESCNWNVLISTVQFFVDYYLFLNGLCYQGCNGIHGDPDCQTNFQVASKSFCNSYTVKKGFYKCGCTILFYSSI